MERYAARDSTNFPREKKREASASSVAFRSSKSKAMAGRTSRSSVVSGLRRTLKVKGGRDGLAGTETCAAWYASRKRGFSGAKLTAATWRLSSYNQHPIL
jgi:hypothetical protein